MCVWREHNLSHIGCGDSLPEFLSSDGFASTKSNSPRLWPRAQKEIANGVKKRVPKSALAANAGQGRNQAVNQSCRAIPRPGASWFPGRASGTDDPARQPPDG